MGSATNKPDQHRQYEQRYLCGKDALDSADGVRQLLGEYHALRQRRFAGDYAACDVLIDLENAIERAGLTDRQRQALRLVYVEDLTQKDAGARMGVNRVVVQEHVEKAAEAIAEVYYYWSGHNEGYSITGGVSE